MVGAGHYSWSRQMLLGDFIYNAAACALHSRAVGEAACIISTPDAVRYAPLAEMLQVTFDQRVHQPVNLDKPCSAMFLGYCGVKAHLWGAFETLNQLMAQGHWPRATLPPRWQEWLRSHLPPKYVLVHTRKRNEIPGLSKRDPDGVRLWEVVERVIAVSGLPVVLIGEPAYFACGYPHVDLRGTKDLGRDMAAIIGAAGYIGCNSGPQHMAWVANIPSLMIDYTHGERAEEGIQRMKLPTAHKYGWQYLDKDRHPLILPRDPNHVSIADHWARRWLI